MSSILYYSNYCENSKLILANISKSSVKDSIHFMCIDKRIQKNNNTYIVLENNQHIILPNTITAVPALLLINQNYKVLCGNQILEYLKPVEDVLQMQSSVQGQSQGQGQGQGQSSGQGQSQGQGSDEPSAFRFSGGFSEVVSDNYSFLDQNSDDLSAKGDGGMRQLYNYATIDHTDKINTPPDDYIPDKIGEVNLKNLESERNAT
jgi:hypothetical protein